MNNAWQIVQIVCLTGQVSKSFQFYLTISRCYFFFWLHPMIWLPVCLAVLHSIFLRHVEPSFILFLSMVLWQRKICLNLFFWISSTKIFHAYMHVLANEVCKSKRQLHLFSCCMLIKSWLIQLGWDGRQAGWSIGWLFGSLTTVLQVNFNWVQKLFRIILVYALM